MLAVALLLTLPGCGGGSDSDSETTAAPSNASAESEPGASGSPADPTQAEPRVSKQKAEERARLEAQINGEAPPSGGGKHGTRITPPKGPREPAPTDQQLAEATVANISLASPAVSAPGPESTGILPATYTCDGKDTWPQLQWQGVPAGTAELALFVLDIEPKDGALFFDWALAGIDPSLEGIESGRLPKGVVVGRNSFGKTDYEICPKGGPETMIFALYALPQTLGAKQGFDPAALRKEVLDISPNAGLMAVSYGGG